MVEKKIQNVKKTVFGHVSRHSEIHHKFQVSVDYLGGYDIPSKNAQGKYRYGRTSLSELICLCS